MALILVKEIVQDQGLVVVAGKEGLDRKVISSEVPRPGLELAGFFEHFGYERIIVLGRTELAYLGEQTAETRKVRLRQLLFFNIPPVCTIKIYTMSGDLVKTIHHTDGTSEEAWNQVTEYNQLIYTGVYLYALESDMGNKTGKFVVVRTSTEESAPQ